jgi:two-component system, LytTR family, response regulator
MIEPAIRTVIAEDEPLAREKLRILLAAEPGLAVVAQCKTGGETITALENLEPDLLFLDIQMPEADGFEVLNAIPADHRPIVVLTTAYDHYAVRAYEEHVVDYLLKPFDRERLHSAVSRVRTQLFRSCTSQSANRILAWLAEGNSFATHTKRLVVKTGGRILFLNTHEIDWIEASANYVKLHVGNHSYVLREGIGNISARLDSGIFIRIHRSIIVNVEKIRELQPCNSGEYVVVLRDGRELSCSRSYRPGLQAVIARG